MKILTRSKIRSYKYVLNDALESQGFPSLGLRFSIIHQPNTILGSINTYPVHMHIDSSCFYISLTMSPFTRYDMVSFMT